MGDYRDIIKTVQTKLGLTVDGIAGPKTWAAISSAVGYVVAQNSIFTGTNMDVTATVNGIPAEVTVNPDASGVDARSMGNIQTLLPVVQPRAIRLIKELARQGITAKVTSGTRTYEEQDIIYAQGRTAPGKIVTNARAGHSNHNFGLAFDITLFKGNEPLWESPNYDKAGELGKSYGLMWGGDWKTQDKPHFEFRPTYAKDMTESDALAEYRSRRMQGIAVV